MLRVPPVPQYPNDRSVCERIKKCRECCKQIEIKAKINLKGGRPKKSSQHKCGVAECRICCQSLEVSTHKCYIQPVDSREDMPKPQHGKAMDKKAKRFLAKNKYLDAEDSFTFLEEG